jgi:hypothetical protein
LLTLDVLENREDDTVMEYHGVEALYSTMKSLIHAIQTEDQTAEQNAVHWMLHIVKPWMIRRWFKLKLANAKPQVPIPKETANLIHSNWTKKEQVKLNTLMEEDSSSGVLGVRTDIG